MNSVEVPGLYDRVREMCATTAPWCPVTRGFQCRRPLDCPHLTSRRRSARTQQKSTKGGQTNLQTVIPIAETSSR